MISLNSFLFLPFLVLVFSIYWLVRKSSISQNIVLFGASLAFIGYNDLQALAVITAMGIANYYFAYQLNKTQEGTLKKTLFYSFVVIDILALSYFKYLNDLWLVLSNYSLIGICDFTTILLPLGMSFFTFQMIGYLIDVYNEEVSLEKNWLHYGVWIFYFPKMVSGPIESKQAFTPQLNAPRPFDTALITDGLRQILWGFFKKTVVSSGLVQFYGIIYNHESMTGADVVLTAIINISQIYFDFSGYSDMACGVSKLFGIRITNNFAFPFFSTSVSEFWKKWHISLTSWIVKYIFTPLSFLFRKYGKIGLFIAILISFLIIGIWHGASANYIIFGALHGLYFIPQIVKGGGFFASAEKRNLWTPLKMIAVFMVVAITSLFFRNVTPQLTLIEMQKIFTPSILHINTEVFHGLTYKSYWLLLIAAFTVEFINKKQTHGLDIAHFKTSIRWSFYLAILFAIFFFGIFQSSSFVYVQF